MKFAVVIRPCCTHNKEPLGALYALNAWFIFPNIITMIDVELPSTLSEAAISSLPQSAYYIPNFISQAEEEFLLRKVISFRL